MSAPENPFYRLEWFEPDDLVPGTTVYMGDWRIYTLETVWDRELEAQVAALVADVKAHVLDPLPEE